MSTAETLSQVAETDATFSRRGPDWVGKCLICNGPIAFDARTGEGATLEHIRARGRGGTDHLENLGVVHGRCNWEKGRRWDPRRRRNADDTTPSSPACSNADAPAGAARATRRGDDRSPTTDASVVVVRWAPPTDPLEHRRALARPATTWKEWTDGKRRQAHA